MTTPLKKRKEKEYQAKIRDIFICSKGDLAPFATVFSFPAENFDQHKFGTIFGIIKVDDRSEDSSYVVNLLTSVIKKEYFGKLHRPPEESFEASLRKTNLALAELVRHGATSWAGKINFVCGAIEKNNLHFACLGDVSIFLIRGGEIAEISTELEKEKDAESHPLKTFSNASSGKLEIGDKLIFTTKELNDIFSPEELRQNASLFSREEFPGFLEISLKANSELAGSIVVDLDYAAEAKTVVIKAPVIGKEKLKKIDSFVGTVDAAEAKSSDRGLTAVLSEETTISREISRKKIFQNFFGKVKQIFSPLWQSARQINFGQYFAKISSWIKILVSKTRISLVFAFKKIKGINWKEKGMVLKMAAGIIVLGTAIYSLAVFVKNRNEQKRLAQESITQTAEPAPADQNLEDVNVKNVETIDDFANLDQEGVLMALLGNFLYVVPEKNHSVLKVDLGSQNIEELKANLNVGNFKLAAAMPNLGSLFFLTDDNKIVSLTPINRNFQENSISLPGNLKAADVKTYLTYLYALDIGGNQIYRYPRAEGGFGEMQNWLRSEADIKNAKGLAINDDLFVASQNDITAYLQGKVDNEVSFEKPDVPLSIDKIFSEPDMEGIYILDNKNHRVVKFGKDGKILSQFFNPDIVSVKDFSVDEKNKVVYLLKANQLLKFSIE